MERLQGHMYVLTFIGGCVSVLTRDLSTLIRGALLNKDKAKMRDKEEVVRLKSILFGQARGGNQHVRFMEVLGLV